MAIITGRVQEDKRDFGPQTITVGEPFARKGKDGKYYCIETGKEYKVIKVNIKEFMSRVKTHDQDQKE